MSLIYEKYKIFEKEDIRSIVDILISNVEKLMKKQGITINVSDDAKVIASDVADEVKKATSDVVDIAMKKEDK